MDFFHAGKLRVLARNSFDQVRIRAPRATRVQTQPTLATTGTIAVTRELQALIAS
jgi:hypothetical protein